MGKTNYDIFLQRNTAVQEKKAQTSDEHKIMGEYQKHYAKQNKSDTKLYDSI